MHKTLRLFLIILSLLFVSACGASVENHQHDYEDIEESVADLEMYTSIDSFELALSSPSSERNSQNNRAQLATISAYYVPTGIPTGYSLGKILAGVSDVSFYYYPSTAIDSETEMMECEATQACFEFRFRRWNMENPLQGIMKQLEQTEDDYIDGKYLYDESVKTYYWVENGDVLSIKIPNDYLTSYSTITSLCTADTIIVK